LPELREEIIIKLKRDNNISAKTSEILVTVGAIESLMGIVKLIIVLHNRFSYIK